MTVVVNTDRRGVEVSWDPGAVDPDAHPEHPIVIPPPVDPDAHPEHPIVLPDPPPDLIDEIPPETLEKLKDFWLGNLPPYEGAPSYPAPVGAVPTMVQIFAQGGDGEWSNTSPMPNDGFGVLTYPADFSGSSYVEVRDLDGNVVDSGTITV